MESTPSPFVASCHCGNVRLSAPQAPESVTLCNCSVCHRIGALWAYYCDGSVSIEVGAVAQETYRWASQRLGFHHCPVCGCVTHYTSIRDDGMEKVAINSRMVEQSVTRHIPVRRFDGAVSWRYLD